MTQEDRGLEELARAIAAGAKVDWSSTESGTTDERTRQGIREMAVIAAIANLHASQPLPADAPQAPPPREPSGDARPVWGAFRLLEKVGEGAYGEVYRAWDARLDREVALKLLPADLANGSTATSIIEEGRLLARVRHPNVVTIYGAECSDGRIGLWMEFVRGRTLEQILVQGGPLSESETVAIGLELCHAVSAVHDAGLLHRDINAQNVMRSEDGRIAPMDFGTGRKLADEALSDLAGTPLYLAPEVLHGQPATVRSDLYSLGVLLYHLVTGSYPVHARTVRDMRMAHERGERTRVRAANGAVSPKLARVIERAIEPDPERRCESARALAADLSALRPRSIITRLTTAAGVAAACVLVASLGWEFVARRSGSSFRPGVMLGSLVHVRPAADQVVAVLPFTNLSDQPDSEYFVDGLVDEIIRDLAVVQGLEVVARTSSFAFKDQPRDLRRVGERLGASLVVEGSVLRTDARLQIQARLVEVAGDTALWAEQFEGQVEDIFAIRDQISRAVIDRLRLTSAKARPQHATSVAAYDLYLRGRALVDRRGPINARAAAELFERAIAIDAAFAPAYAGLANAHAFMSFPFSGTSFEASYPVMKQSAAKALELDPTLAEAHMAAGWVYTYEHDWENAGKAFRQAIALNRSYTQTYTSYSLAVLQPLRKFTEALELLQEAARHDPLSLDVQREIGEVQLFSGRYPEAIATLRHVMDVEPDFPFVETYLARALTYAGKTEEALYRLRPESPYLAQLYVTTGRRADAERLAIESQAYPFRLAIIAAALGDTARVVDALERISIDQPQRLGRVLIEPELARFLDHPRVVALRKAFDLP